MSFYPLASFTFLPFLKCSSAGIHFEEPRAAAVNRCSDVSFIPWRLLNVPIVWLASSFVGSGNRVNRSGVGGPSTFSLWAAFTNGLSTFDRFYVFSPRNSGNYFAVFVGFLLTFMHYE